MCCSKGDVVLAKTILPPELVHLLTGIDAKSKNFQNMIQTYNNHFAFTCIGITCDEKYQRRDRGVYTVRMQGQIHHYLNDILPQDVSGRLSGIQFYFYDNDNVVSNRMNALPRLDENLVRMLVQLLKSNPYAEFLKHALELENIDECQIIIRSDPGLDQRRYNRPLSSEVAGIWVEDDNGENNNSDVRDIRVYTKSGRSHNVQHYFGCYDPLQYVLMFPNCEPGWHPNIPKGRLSDNLSGCPSGSSRAVYNFIEDVLAAEVEVVDTERGGPSSSTSGRKRKRQNVSCREYYAYRLHFREDDSSFLLRFGRLFQQYVVDNYVKIESMRLKYQRKNQKNTKRDYYQGVVDSVVSGVSAAGRIGQRVYLPASFIGGPRDMRHCYLNSMTLVQEYGRPDLFLTMTCNPNWPEVKDLLRQGEEAQNRSDLLARVFKAKLAILNDKIMSGEIFGEVAFVIHVIEFHKRGLPHAHFLIILKPAFKYMNLMAYDKTVSAELPYPNTKPYLYSLVVKHIMHGPCDVLNKDNVCMREGKCKNHYPKDYVNCTTYGKGSYPVYRRRCDNISAKIRGQMLDNRCVVPYNPRLLAEFDCHINIEICCDILSVKYLYKYVHKGHDKILFRVAPDSSLTEVDEITQFQNARWVSPVESIWRIFSLPLHGMVPSVLQLQVHLPNFQTIHFEEDANLEDVLNDETLKQTMLTEFFCINVEDPEARELNLLYKEFPKYFVWNSQLKTWTKRKRGVVVGRLCGVHPAENKRYYLRVLLSNVRCPLSFKDLLTVDGKCLASFQEAAHKRGLPHRDDDVEKSMEEVSVYGMPIELRRLFATLLHYCIPSNASKLFMLFFEQMADDLRRTQSQTGDSDNDILLKVLEGINDTLETLGRNINEFHLVGFKYEANQSECRTREFRSETSIPVPVEDLLAFNDLNYEQRVAYDTLLNRSMSDEGGAFFVDGPGGTGKSFLHKVLLAQIRSKGFIALVVASSGIAASGFLGGRSAHSRFKIPIDEEPPIHCQISMQSTEADLIRMSKIIIWDEALMANKSVIHALNELLQQLCGNQEIFGGKLVVFGGDFRQVLPVVKDGGRKD